MQKYALFYFPPNLFRNIFVAQKVPTREREAFRPCSQVVAAYYRRLLFFALFLWRGLQTSTFYPYPPNLFAKIFRNYAAQHALEIEIRKEEAGIRNCHPVEGGGEQQRTAGGTAEGTAAGGGGRQRTEEDGRGGRQRRTAGQRRRDSVGGDQKPVLPWDPSLLHIRAYACARITCFTPRFYRKLYTGEDKLLSLSGMRVKGWDVKLYTNYSP